VLALAIAVALIVGALLIALSGGGPGPVPPPTPPGASLPAVVVSASPAAPSLPPATTVTPDAVIGVDSPIALAAGGSSLWVLRPGLIDEIDPGSNTVSGSATLDSTTDEYQGIAATGAGVWATNLTTQRLVRVDPATLTVKARTPAGLAPKGVLTTADAVWVADLHGGAVLRVDPATDTVVATVTVGPKGSSGPNWLGSGLGSIWVDIPNNGTIVRVSPVTNTVQATIAVPTDLTACGGIAVDTDAVWVSSCSAGTVLIRVDPVTNTVVATVELGGFAGVTLVNGAPWVSVDPGTADAGYLARIDPATNTIDRVVVPGTAFGGGGDIVVAAGSVWVIDGYHGKLLRLPMSAFAL
jgi:streptogramin lyase